VWGFWLIEAKRWFSIAVLCFEDGSREAFHEHAFNSMSWVLKGELHEEFLGGQGRPHTPSWRPIVTKRRDFHKVASVGRTWVLTFRGPWVKTWREWLPKEQRYVTLTDGREIVG
jgi:hypothetical protein